MDCSVPVDDYCDVSQGCRGNLETEIPPADHNGDQFRIEFEVEKIFPIIDKDGEVMEFVEDEAFVRVEDRKNFTFWESCPRLKEKNLMKKRVSAMLSAVGVVRHKQDFMGELISCRADEIAKANKDSKVLHIFVFVSIIACSCYKSS